MGVKGDICFILNVFINSENVFLYYLESKKCKKEKGKKINERNKTRLQNPTWAWSPALLPTTCVTFYLLILAVTFFFRYDSYKSVCLNEGNYLLWNLLFICELFVILLIFLFLNVCWYSWLLCCVFSKNTAFSVVYFMQIFKR